jgi:transposase
MEKQRRKYAREFKIEAVRLHTEKGATIAQVSKDLGISPHLLCRWKKKFQDDGDLAFPGKGHLKPEEEELRRLRRENEVLRQERDILKKAAAFFARESH